jgi:hypothetical protein
MHEVRPLFQYEIIKGARIYREDEQLADKFEENVMKQAKDLLFKKRIFDHEVWVRRRDSGFYQGL